MDGELAQPKFTYITVCTKIAKARPHSEEWQTDTSVQKQWSVVYLIDNVYGFLQKWSQGSNSEYIVSVK